MRNRRRLGRTCPSRSPVKARGRHLSRGRPYHQGIRHDARRSPSPTAGTVKEILVKIDGPVGIKSLLSPGVDQQLVGIVTRANLRQAVACLARTTAHPTAKDAAGSASRSFRP